MTEGDIASHERDHGDFYVDYAEALNAYLVTRDEASLAIGHELGRRALRDRMSMLDIIENHAGLVQGRDTPPTPPRHFSSCCRRWRRSTWPRADSSMAQGVTNRQRARAEDLADRDEFRSALVNSLAGGFLRRRSHRHDRRDQ